MSNIDDQKIIEGIVAGDEAVFKAFYKKNRKYIRQYILKNSGNEDDVEDVFQDAVVFIYQKLKAGSLELRSPLSTYFYGVSKNIWRNRLRKNRKLVVTEEIPEDTAIVEASILEEIEDREREHVYRKHFVNLSDTCREVLQLLFLGKSMKEIAEITGYAEGYTRKKKFECKKHLIEMIEQDPIYQELKITSEKK